MRKVKTAFVILLTVVLLGAGSLLPGTAAHFLDKTNTNAVQYENIEALQLRLEEEAMSMTFHEKLRLISKGVGVEVPDAETKVTEGEILEITNAALLPYMQLFFGRPLDNDFLHYNKAIVYDESNTRMYYCWFVQISTDASYNDYISVVLDDESGKVLAIEMNDPDFDIDAAYLQELQDNLAAMYFESLGLRPVTAWPAAEDVAPIDGGDNRIVASSYQLVDTVYGEVIIEIGVHTDGFYIYIA